MQMAKYEEQKQHKAWERIEDLEGRMQKKSQELNVVKNESNQLQRDKRDLQYEKEMEIGFRTRFEEQLNDLHSLNRKYADKASQNYSALRATCNEYESLKGNHIEQKNKLSDETSLRKNAEFTRTRAIEKSTR